MSILAVEEAQIPLAADDFNALEQRVLRMVELVKSEREARAAADARIHSLEATVKSLEDSGLNAEQRVIALEERLQDANKKAVQATTQFEALEKERDVVRLRVEKLLKQLDDIPA